MDRAKSEDVVPSAHGEHQNPQAIEDVLRILKSDVHQRSADNKDYPGNPRIDFFVGAQRD